MKIGFIGLGRMGQLVVEKLVEGGIEVVVYNRTKDITNKFSSRIANPILEPAYNLKEFIQKLGSPRIIFIMVKAGRPVSQMLEGLLWEGLGKGDIVVDLGNSYFRDSARRSKNLKDKGIYYLDIGTSGGIKGAQNGFSFMVGGEKGAFEIISPLLEILAKPNGSFDYFGKSGSGHFVKIVHNGIEYGMLESIAEGFSMLHSRGEYDIELIKAAKVWSKGSIVRGYLMDLMKIALEKDPSLNSIEGVAGGGETGEWALKTAHELGLEVPVIEDSVNERKKTTTKPTFTGKVIAALRLEFGGHKV
ncbi:decarboxylating 6-phosphogluconate dehydrogenase [Candidatus Gottesmanbacteria bacterium]|nr:decarboxylating 6-phosphogluconate dehydrogenase [Candidatus Gottesmanbacteria bacterium]